MTCHSPLHDHLEEDGSPMTCVGCGAPCHYDDAVGDYRHDELELQCVQTGPGGGCLTLSELEELEAEMDAEAEEWNVRPHAGYPAPLPGTSLTVES